MQRIEATLAEVFSHAEQQQQPTQTIEEETAAARREDWAGLQAIVQHVGGLAALRGEMQSKLGLDDRPALLAAAHVMFHAGARRRGGVPSVAVALKGRPWSAVVSDMIEGVVVANGLSGAKADRARAALWLAVDDSGELAAA